MTYHIIPDIHGEASELDALLVKLGWRRKFRGGWIHDEPGAHIVFMGDFIDRGPENARVLKIVRSLLDSGKGSATLGNHELNALMFHHKGADGYLRKHTEANVAQHEAFLREFPLGSREASEALQWMHSLPVCYENDWFRAIHACWHAPSIERFAIRAGRRLLPEDLSELSGDLFKAAELIMKGPEYAPGNGFSFSDHSGVVRKRVRLNWWHQDPKSWAEVAASIPEGFELPVGDLPQEIRQYQYQESKPVFFGHYWLTGDPVISNPRAMCLDYSVARGGPLLAYRFEPGAKGLDLSCLVAA